jgi:hypothetical protein
VFEVSSERETTFWIQRTVAVAFNSIGVGPDSEAYPPFRRVTSKTLSENLSSLLGSRIGLWGLSMVVADYTASGTGGVVPVGEVTYADTGALRFGMSDGANS